MNTSDFMTPVLTPKEMASIEQAAYKAGATEEAFMEAAGGEVAKVVTKLRPRRVVLLCGPGNNGGDARVAGRLLRAQGVPVVEANEETSFFPGDVIIDGLFGTGFHGVVEGKLGKLIQRANGSGQPIVAVDIPSGVNGETGAVEGPAIIAHTTCFLEAPKTGFFLREGVNHIGTLYRGRFGLDEKYLQSANAPWAWLEKETLPHLPPIKRDRHKYQAGHIAVLAGSPGMPGSAILACRAAMRSGAGIVHLLHPEGMEVELAQLDPEIVRRPYNVHDIEEMLALFNRASAALIGPGLGRSPIAQVLIEGLLPHIDTPLVLDADALNSIAEGELSPPQGALLTPHRGEMSSLLQCDCPKALDEAFLTACDAYAKKHGVTLVLKGAPTFVFSPGEQPVVATLGHPALASAGTGDVFAGLTAALMGLRLKPRSAGLFGAFLQGVAAESLAERTTPYGLVASQLAEEIPLALAALLAREPSA